MVIKIWPYLSNDSIILCCVQLQSSTCTNKAVVLISIAIYCIVCAIAECDPSISISTPYILNYKLSVNSD